MKKSLIALSALGLVAVGASALAAGDDPAMCTSSTCHATVSQLTSNGGFTVDGAAARGTTYLGAVSKSKAKFSRCSVQFPIPDVSYKINYKFYNLNNKVVGQGTFGHGDPVPVVNNVDVGGYVKLNIIGSNGQVTLPQPDKNSIVIGCNV